MNKRFVLGALLWGVGAITSMTPAGWPVGVPLLAAAGYLFFYST